MLTNLWQTETMEIIVYIALWQHIWNGGTEGAIVIKLDYKAGLGFGNYHITIYDIELFCCFDTKF